MTTEDHGASASRTVSLVIPVYNSRATLPQLAERLRSVLAEVAPAGGELVLVNDGSPDGSWEKVRQLAETHDWITGINLLRNSGQHNALLCGIRAAKYDTIVTIDDDLQNPPEEMIRLLNKLDEGFDVVYGAPIQARHGLWRNLASRLTKLALSSALGAATATQVSAFRAFKTDVRKGFAGYTGPFVSIDVLLTWGANRFASVPVRHDARIEGASNYTFRKLLRHTLNMVTGFSTLPLRFAAFLGFLLCCFGLAILSYVLWCYITRGTSVPGFPFLASIISIFSGAQMLVLGILGEYLAGMHFRLMGKPSYVVADVVHSSLITSGKVQNVE
jgi:undecaprenyl-phosphate 4-deoxy-4-formamido-L-arabinose transferase